MSLSHPDSSTIILTRNTTSSWHYYIVWTMVSHVATIENKLTEKKKYHHICLLEFCNKALRQINFVRCYFGLLSIYFQEADVAILNHALLGLGQGH